MFKISSDFIGKEENNTRNPSISSHLDEERSGNNNSVEEVLRKSAAGSKEPVLTAQSVPCRTRFFSTRMPSSEYVFYDREDILQKLTEALAPTVSLTNDNHKLIRQRKITFLHGLGAIGKPVCATKWLYSDAACFHAVFWIKANNIFHLGRSIHDAAVAIGLVPNRNCHNHEKSRTEFISWLENADSNWLLVFDDVEDVNLLQLYIPRGQFGSILITTRQTASASFLLNLRNAEHIDVPPFSADESLALLKLLAPNIDGMEDFEAFEDITGITGRSPLGVRLLGGVYLILGNCPSAPS